MSDEPQDKQVKPRALVTKTISMPDDLFTLADAKVQADEELDWSKYVRRLIREDLARAQATEQQPS